MDVGRSLKSQWGYSLSSTELHVKEYSYRRGTFEAAESRKDTTTTIEREEIGSYISLDEVTSSKSQAMKLPALC